MPLNIDKPHDAIFQGLLSDPQRSQSVLRAHLEPWMTEMLADEPPVPLDTSFVDEDLRRSQSDKLLQVRLKDGEPGFVYALLEHKSYPVAGTALQVWKYKVRIWERYAGKVASKLRALPSIIPVVFYHGAQDWGAPWSIREMLATGHGGLRDLEPEFGYYLRDLRTIPAEQLASDAATRAGLVALRHSHGSQEARLSALPEVVAGPRSGSEYERQVFVYLMGVWQVPAQTLAEVAEQAKPGRGKAVVGQVLQEILDRGEAKGLVKGLVKGEAKGLVKGLACALTRLLESRFDRLPGTVLRRIATARTSEPDAWFTVSLGAESLREVFPDLGLDLGRD